MTVEDDVRDMVDLMDEGETFTSRIMAQALNVNVRTVNAAIGKLLIERKLTVSKKGRYRELKKIVINGDL